MSLAGEVTAHLEQRSVKCALIGGAALAVHGIARATLDSDLLVSTPKVLQRSFWAELGAEKEIEIRKGDADDPLAGVVRVWGRNERIDVIVGRRWTRRALARAGCVRIGGEALAVVDRPDLVLLKLFAGGPQDLLDVKLLLAQSGPGLAAEIDRRLGEVPDEVRRTWRRVREEMK